MNSKKFTEAMSEIDNKYVSEALSYNRTRLLKKSHKRDRSFSRCCHSGI